MPGPAWQAFEASARGEFAVLLVDEVDKTNPGFDAFLLRLLEEWTFRSPEGEEIRANPARLAVVLTTNGRRHLRPEVLRRCQRVQVPVPENGRLHKIIRQIAGTPIPDNLLELAIRLGRVVGEKDEEQRPSPKELALLCIDLLTLVNSDEDNLDIWQSVAASWLVKSGGPQFLDKAVKFRWAQALRNEAGKK